MPLTGLRSESRPPAFLPSWLLWVGLAAFAASLGLWAAVLRQNPVQLWAMLDLRCYYEAGRQILHGPGLYSLRYSPIQIPFIYPPFAALALSLPAHVSFATVRWLMTASGCFALIAVSWIAWGMLGHARGAGRLGAALITAALALWLEPVQQNLIWGQINLLLMLLVMADYALPDRCRLKGLGIGVAAGFKLTPAVHILYLLATRRFRQAAVATGGFAACAVIGVLCLPRESAQYWLGGQMLGVGGRTAVSHMSNQSLHALLGRILHDGPHTSAAWLAVGVPLLAFGVILAARRHREGHELIGILAVAITGVLVSPISWSHHWVWILLGLVAALDRALRAVRGGRFDALLPPAALLLVFGAWSGTYAGSGPVIPMGIIWNTPFMYPAMYEWHGTQLVQGNLYIVLGLGFLLALLFTPLTSLNPLTSLIARSKRRPHDLADLPAVPRQSPVPSLDAPGSAGP